MYTSGSTGLPRGVMVSHLNLRANTESILEYLRLRPDDRALLVLPLGYCYGASVLHTHLRVGGSVVIDRFSFPELALDRLGGAGCTGLPGVPGTFQILLRRSTFRQRGFPALRYVTVAGGRLPDTLLSELRQSAPQAAVFVMYGQTEATARLSYLPPERLDDKLGSIGCGLPGAPLRVERPDGGEVAAGSGEVGEIVARGDHVTLGYYRNPEETAHYFRDGALHTGDLATVDADGFIYVVDRAREFLKSMGYRVAPREIEEVLARLPDVVESAAFGAPDALRGEAIVVAVVVRPGAGLDEKAVLKHCAAHLAPYKRPQAVTFLDALPKNEAGKILRRELVALYRAPKLT
jgi:acyl-CoA synthetase (AMP-forming)/AMP-acid ligase II